MCYEVEERTERRGRECRCEKVREVGFERERQQERQSELEETHVKSSIRQKLPHCVM